MNIESLKKAREAILETLMKLKINGKDKADMMFDQTEFLDERYYEKNVKAIRKIRRKK